MTADSHRNDRQRLPREQRLPRDLAEFEALLEQAARRGAKEALKGIGLDDGEAARDIHDLRELAASLKSAQRTFVQTLVRWLTIGFLALLAAGIVTKVRFFTSE